MCRFSSTFSIIYYMCVDCAWHFFNDIFIMADWRPCYIFDCMPTILHERVYFAKTSTPIIKVLCKYLNTLLLLHCFQRQIQSHPYVIILLLVCKPTYTTNHRLPQPFTFTNCIVGKSYTNHCRLLVSSLRVLVSLWTVGQSTSTFLFICLSVIFNFG